jgi:hypothetical protein
MSVKDVRDPGAIWFKGGLFLVVGVVAMVLLFMEAPTMRMVSTNRVSTAWTVMERH